ncbi:hypothetical protein A4X03_0g9541 [Tilletia caries]|uniref:SWIM-type domain-containing protein n=1 Tax=Tilletia caries TaxID=13290 RepID=A0A8T8SAW2_9BASI|nr:hypothetical protein A4X03_0g9541 [Tilletia caries]
MDGTGSLIVLAWALTPGETTENWTWFMKHLRTSLHGLNDFGTCIVSDRNAALLEALEDAVPAAKATYCCFHIAKNIKENHHSAAAVRLFWKMVYCRTKAQFDGHMDSLKVLDEEGQKYIAAIDATKWATHAVSGRRFGHVTSNLAEIANAMLLEARALPPLACLDYIYRHQMEKFFFRRAEAIKCGSPIVPAEYSRLQKTIQEAQKMTAICSDRTSGCVTSQEGTQYVVKLPSGPVDVGKCDCKQYQALLRPCKHAVALLQKLKVSVAPYCHGYYTTDSWKKMYAQSYPTISITNLEDSDLHAPAFKRKRGRPQVERKEKGQGPSSRHCSICGLEGHRYRDCSMTWDL